MHRRVEVSAREDRHGSRTGSLGRGADRDLPRLVWRVTALPAHDRVGADCLNCRRRGYNSRRCGGRGRWGTGQSGAHRGCSGEERRRRGPPPAGWATVRRMVASTEDCCSPTAVVAAPENHSASARTRPQGRRRPWAVPVSLDDLHLMTWPCECGHLAADHDPTAAKFCAATRAGRLPRTCICLPADDAALDRLTGRERPR
jgi:hypothetical protein